MKNNINNNFLDNIAKNISDLTPELQNDISILIDKYTQQEQQIKELSKKNNFFLRKWDKENILIKENDAKKDKMIEQQSRLAAMGEMIDAIAHQWKQPLNAISMLIDMLKTDFEDGSVDTTYIKDLEKTAQMQIDHMVSTLSEFRNFLRPSTKNEDFFIHSPLANVLVLMKDELISQNIHIYTDFDHEVKIHGNKNEFKHLFLNLINNSIDAFNEKHIHKREISIKAYAENKNVYIEVQDNAGGIPEKIINDIFKPNVTTKAAGKGTGIGLYMSSQIVTKNNGSINVHNTKQGAFFTVIIPISIY